MKRLNSLTRFVIQSFHSTLPRFGKGLLVLAFSSALLACSSTTLITSTDRKVKIFVNDELLGRGTVVYKDTKIIGSTNVVTLRKSGCRDQFKSFSRTEEFDVGACLGGLFVWVPFLWIMKYKPTHKYDFTCEKK